MLATAHPVAATTGCDIIASETAEGGAPLYPEPDAATQPLRVIPLGDIVHWPQEELAPGKADCWEWVGHTAHQRSLGGDATYGWVRADRLGICG